MIRPKKPRIDPISGYSIEASMLGSFVSVIDADWWRVLHQSTDFLIIGMFTAPTITSHESNLSAFSKLLKELWKEIKPRYMINKINVEVILASHCHHVPQVGIPHIEPDTSAINVVMAPMGAIDIIMYADNFTLHTMYTKLQIAMAAYSDWEIKEAGTCKYIILKEFPWTKSSGVNNRPQIIENTYIKSDV